MENHSDNHSPAFVKISPPLPFILDERLQGFALELSSHQLILKLARNASGPVAQTLSGSASSSQLLVSSDDGTVHRLEVTITPAQGPLGAGDLLATVANEPSSRQLADLLTILRKKQHISICQSQDVEASDRFTGFSDLSFVPKTISELNWEDLDTTSSFLGRQFKLPLLITGMTGGIEKGAEINRRLALAASRYGIPMGVGSQRIAVENPDFEAIFAVKKFAPDIFCIANLGAAQVIGSLGPEHCQRTVDMIQADALAIHVNILQEAVQVEGDRRFRGLFASIERVVKSCSVPVIVKEVGAGMDVETAKQLFDSGVRAIDVGGKGGTSWSLIEGQRSSSRVVQEVARSFRDWGIPTAYSLAAVCQEFPAHQVTATGGIRDGITVAKAVALGARLAGIGLPLFRAALESEEGPCLVLESLVQQLKTTMLCVGATNLAQLRSRLTFGRPYQDRFRAAATLLPTGPAHDF